MMGPGTAGRNYFTSKETMKKLRLHTGCFLMKQGKYELITPFKMSLYWVKLDAKFH